MGATPRVHRASCTCVAVHGWCRAVANTHRSEGLVPTFLCHWSVEFAAPSWTLEVPHGFHLVGLHLRLPAAVCPVKAGVRSRTHGLESLFVGSFCALSVRRFRADRVHNAKAP